MNATGKVIDNFADGLASIGSDDIVGCLAKVTLYVDWSSETLILVENLPLVYPLFHGEELLTGSIAEGYMGVDSVQLVENVI